MKAIIRYPGSKWGIANWIISHFPDGYEKMVYLEPFCGSGAVFFNKVPGAVETINDLDSDIVNLFRVKREDNGEWGYGYLVKLPSAIHIGDYTHPWFIFIPPRAPDDNGGYYPVVSDTVGQFTGLTDKNGVKIFEGDIVRISLPLPSQDPIVVVSSVVFCNGCFMVTWGGSLATFDSFVNTTEFEVIGNVHDNPVILEVANDH